MKTIRKQTLCLIAIVFACGVYFNLLRAAEEKNAISAEQAWQLLKEGNERFAADRSEHKDLGQKRRRNWSRANSLLPWCWHAPIRALRRN